MNPLVLSLAAAVALALPGPDAAPIDQRERLGGAQPAGQRIIADFSADDVPRAVREDRIRAAGPTRLAPEWS